MLRLMKRAGCQWVKIGLETTNGALLEKLERIDSEEQATRYLQQVGDVVRTCNETGLYCRLFVMAGLPGQDEVMAQHTRRFVQQLQPTALNVKGFKEYPGMRVAARAEEDVALQVKILRQAQEVIQSSRPVPSLMTKGRRWLRRALRGQRHG
jgi:radical SAM superfamily enzyme YgiQ (UPF0313 family)